jgi:tetratricopeptide (TPR) repeat protein
MPICVFLVVALFGVSGSAWADVVPQRKWLQVRSPHFTVMGEAGARDLRLVAERMEQLHAALGQMTKSTQVETSDVTIIVFKTEAGFRPFQRRYQGKPVPAAGYFLPGPMNYIAILADRDYDYSDVVYHEYVHLVANRAIGSMPVWMSEGVAEFYSTFQPIDSGKKARIGDPQGTHIGRLRTEFMPLAALTAVDHDSAEYNERDKQSVFYAESWALYHFLQIGQKQKYAPRLPRFVDSLLSGVPFDRACVEHLGVSMPALESELRQYLGNLGFYHFEVTLPEAIQRIERLQPTAVSEGEAHAVLAQLLIFIGEQDEARAHLEHAISVEPQQALALARLAEQSVTRSPADALALAKRAADAEKRTFISEYYRARALERIADFEASMVEAAAIEGAWRQVLALNPSAAEAYSRLGQMRADARDLDEALTLTRQAVQLAPARDDFMLGLARVLIMRGETKAARGMLGPLLARGATPAIRQGARNYLGVAARVELATAADSEAPMPEPPPALPDEPAPPPPIGEPPAPPASPVPRWLAIRLPPACRPLGPRSSPICTVSATTRLRCSGP